MDRTERSIVRPGRAGRSRAASDRSRGFAAGGIRRSRSSRKRSTSIGFGRTAVKMRWSSPSEAGSNSWPVIRMIGTEGIPRLEPARQRRGHRGWASTGRSRRRRGRRLSQQTQRAPAPERVAMQTMARHSSSSSSRRRLGSWSSTSRMYGSCGRRSAARASGSNAHHRMHSQRIRSHRTTRDLGPGQSKMRGRRILPSKRPARPPWAARHSRQERTRQAARIGSVASCRNL